MADLSRVVDRFMARQKLGAMDPWRQAQDIVQKHRNGIGQDFEKLLGVLARTFKKLKLTLDPRKSSIDQEWNSSEGSARIEFDLYFTDDLEDFRDSGTLKTLLEDQFELYGRLDYKNNGWHFNAGNY